jgi:type II secretory pathway predicted ATPase ExeA
MAKIYPHANFALPREQLRQALENPYRGRFIFVIGPSGVGKTTVRRAILREMCGSPAHWGAGRIPVIEVFALLSHNAYFNSRSLVESMMRELFVPDMRWLRDSDDVMNAIYIAIKREVDRAHQEICDIPVARLPERSLWPQFQRLAAARQVWLTAIDQAGALCTNHCNKDPADHILNLMSILESGDTNILLSGVHSTAELWATRPEVRRRSTVIWMPPYNYERKQDRDPFLILLRTLGQAYNFSKSTLLFDMAPDLMAASAGIFGVVNKILTSAKERADLAGRSVIARGDITDSFYGERDYRKMWEDVHLFEEVMCSANTEVQATRISNAWGLSKKAKRDNKNVPGVVSYEKKKGHG